MILLTGWFGIWESPTTWASHISVCHYPDRSVFLVSHKKDIRVVTVHYRCGFNYGCFWCDHMMFSSGRVSIC